MDVDWATLAKQWIAMQNSQQQLQQFHHQQQHGTLTLHQEHFPHHMPLNPSTLPPALHDINRPLHGNLAEISSGQMYQPTVSEFPWNQQVIPVNPPVHQLSSAEQAHPYHMPFPEPIVSHMPVQSANHYSSPVSLRPPPVPTAAPVSQYWNHNTQAAPSSSGRTSSSRQSQNNHNNHNLNQHHNHHHRDSKSDSYHSHREVGIEIHGSRNQSCPVNTTVYNNDDGSFLDAKQRKQLPAWIREGLERMEKEKLRKLEKEKEEEERRQWLQMQKEKDVVSESGIENIDSKDFSNSTTSYKIVKTKLETDVEQQQFIAEPLPSQEEMQQELMIKVRKFLTEILLEITDEEIRSTAKEVINKAKKSSKVSANKQLAISTPIIKSSGLDGLLSVYGSGSDSENDEHESDEVINNHKSKNSSKVDVPVPHNSQHKELANLETSDKSKHKPSRSRSRSKESKRKGRDLSKEKRRRRKSRSKSSSRSGSHRRRRTRSRSRSRDRKESRHSRRSRSKSDKSRDRK